LRKRSASGMTNLGIENIGTAHHFSLTANLILSALMPDG
jgi:hypothetical protein